VTCLANHTDVDVTAATWNAQFSAHGHAQFSAHAKEARHASMGKLNQLNKQMKMLSDNSLALLNNLPHMWCINPLNASC
jgi:hypothetical protein